MEGTFSILQACEKLHMFLTGAVGKMPLEQAIVIALEMKKWLREQNGAWNKETKHKTYAMTVVMLVYTVLDDFHEFTCVLKQEQEEV